MVCCHPIYSIPFTQTHSLTHIPAYRSHRTGDACIERCGICQSLACEHTRKHAHTHAPAPHRIQSMAGLGCERSCVCVLCERFVTHSRAPQTHLSFSCACCPVEVCLCRHLICPISCPLLCGGCVVCALCVSACAHSPDSNGCAYMLVNK